MGDLEWTRGGWRGDAGSRDVTAETSLAAALSGCVSYSIESLLSVLDLTLGKTVFVECQIEGTQQSYFFIECFFSALGK